mgnify:CR=1 FL=1
MASCALTTTPRIELSAAKLGSELTVKSRAKLTIEATEEYFWTDSVTVLSYIKNEDKRFHRFVANIQYSNLNVS